MPSFAYRCPFCGHNATIGSENFTNTTSRFTDHNKYGPRAVTWTAITCPNPKCGEYTFRLWIREAVFDKLGNYAGLGAVQHDWQLVPAADMKVLPDYLPVAVLADYKEACLVATLSPKASATLARRCLQGMIRDFWGVKPGRLVIEIAAIEEKVDADTWGAIEAVRTVGNIGAHMEADIDVIVDVEPEEAKLLIGLIETLVDEWYVAKHDRKTRLGKLADLAKQKAQAKKQST